LDDVAGNICPALLELLLQLVDDHAQCAARARVPRLLRRRGCRRGGRQLM